MRSFPTRRRRDWWRSGCSPRFAVERGVTMPAFEGICDAKFSAVPDPFAENFSTGGEAGAPGGRGGRGQNLRPLLGGGARPPRPGPPARETKVVGVFPPQRGARSFAAVLIGPR